MKKEIEERIKYAPLSMDGSGLPEEPPPSGMAETLLDFSSFKAFMAYFFSTACLVRASFQDFCV